MTAELLHHFEVVLGVRDWRLTLKRSHVQKEALTKLSFQFE